MKIRPLTPSAAPPGARLHHPTFSRAAEPAESYETAAEEAHVQPARLRGLLSATGALGLAVLGFLGGVLAVGGLSAEPGPSMGVSLSHNEARQSLEPAAGPGPAQSSPSGSKGQKPGPLSQEAGAGPGSAQSSLSGSGAQQPGPLSPGAEAGPGPAQSAPSDSAAQRQTPPSLGAEGGADRARPFPLSSLSRASASASEAERGQGTAWPLRLTLTSPTEAPSSAGGWLLASGSEGLGLHAATFRLPDASPASEPPRVLRTLPDKPPRPVPKKGDYIRHGVNFSHLLSDAEFTDVDFMTQEEIQEFLESLQSHLARYQEGGRSAAQILAEAARRHQVNPLVILSTLEKESGLVSATSSPPRWRMRSAMGYGYHDGGGRPRKSSFAWQVDKGTELLRQLFDEARSGVTFPTTLRVDYGRRQITVRNAATYALYRYTPHTVDTGLSVVGGGNYNFRWVFQRFYSGYARLLQEQAVSLKARQGQASSLAFQVEEAW